MLKDMELRLAKGTIDFVGQEAKRRDKIKRLLQGIFELHGYEPLETPVVETMDTLTFKGGEEISKEIFQVTDQGNRRLGLRFDHTVPLARYFAMNQRELKLPFRRYAMGAVFRDGPVSVSQGRYRTFTQCDVDIIGVKEMSAEAEILMIANQVFKGLGLGDLEIRVNSRKVLDGILDNAGVDERYRGRVITILDKADKIGFDGVAKELSEEYEFPDERMISNGLFIKMKELYEKAQKEEENRGRDALISENDLWGEARLQVGEEGVNTLLKEVAGSDDPLNKILDFRTRGKKLMDSPEVMKVMQAVSREEDNMATLMRLQREIRSDNGKQGLEEIGQVLALTERLGLDGITFDPSLARGLNYYTGTTFEVYLRDKSRISSAITAGGRFDNMLGQYCGDGQEYPAVGISFGLERLAQISGLDDKRDDLYLSGAGKVGPEKLLEVAGMLREQGRNTTVDLSRNSLKKNMRYADSKGFRYVGIVGEDEISQGRIKIKDMVTGEESYIPLKR